MPKDNRLVSPKPTPIPTTGIELAAAVARIDDRTKQMTEVHLPRVETLATEARDGVVGLDSRVGVLESNPHECDEKDRQVRQDTDIAESKEIVIEHREKIKGLTKFRGWFFGIVGSILTGALVFAISTRSTEATNTANITSNKSNIDRHEEIITDLPRKADLAAVKIAVTEIPAEVQKTIEEENGPTTAEEVSEAVEDLPLKSYELKQMKIILGRAAKRSEGE